MDITKQDVISRYHNGDSTETIASLAGVSSRYIRQVLSEAGVAIRHRTKYSVNESFFSEWSSEMVYVLGFVVTDGCISKNTLSIAQRDPEILRRISEAMSSNIPINERTHNGNPISKLDISRKAIVRDLASLGVMERKSLTYAMPSIPGEYLPHFLRGIIDGDGWVHPKGYTMTITTGSAVFADQLAQVFEHNGYNVRVHKNSGAYRITVSGKDDIARLGRWLYDDCGVLFIERKRERFERRR
ncbi:LAGLIDADG family homing endonuclease [Terribacillus saccharophilus]|uniref:LAGLIDADG family homing endonuclease n=1 Tax=Terribacillus saccharophilus TaxID=361277 RepID=UPI003D2AF4D5